MTFEQKKLPIDVCIVTHNRDQSLFRCVSHILTDTYIPNSLIIIHSQPEDKCINKQKIATLCKRFGVSLHYYHVPHKGISYSRNQSLKYVKSPFFGFIDDDEYPSKDWLKTAHRILINDKTLSAVTGPKFSSNPSNYWNRIWIEIYLNSYTFVGLTDFATSSNTFYRTVFIRKNKIQFDEDFKDSSEDRVFSFLIKKRKGKMLIHKNLTDFHDFRDSAKGFLKQWFGYGETTVLYEKKYFGITNRMLLRTLFNDLQGFRLIKRNNVKLWAGLLSMDIFFSIGFAVGVIKNWNKQKKIFLE